jgi:hypothetical protein
MASTWKRFSRREGAYVAVIGRIKLDGLSPEIQCYDCRPIRNFNDITHHHLSVIATHIDLVQKPVTLAFVLSCCWT